jgi:phospholipid/cholesterol/gamma-HCH transport system substrate-binding protein
MQKTAPTRSRLGLMVVFALSCFAILTYLWKSFGGPTPLAPKAYVVHADFPEATQLATTAQVRIAGVPVGRVTATSLAANRTRTTMEIERRYSPLARDTTAILRQKTLLGETYVELSPGHPQSGRIPDGGSIPRAQVRPTTEIDEVTRTFDPRTRRDAQRILGSLAVAVGARGEQINGSLGNLPPFADDSNRLLQILDTQHDAVRRLVADTGVVFDAVGRQNGELSGLIRSGDQVLQITARRNADLADTVRILPTTLAELRPTLAELQTVSRDAQPVVGELRPAAVKLAPALIDTAALAPDLRALFTDVGRVTDVSGRALPAATAIVRAAHPVFRILVPTLQQALPVVQFLGIYKEELVTAISTLAAATQGSQPAVSGGPPIHYLRALVPFTSEGVAAQNQREGTNRHNPYLLPLGLLKLKRGLDSFDCSNIGNSSTGEPAPACRVQAPLPFEGRRTAYPHVLPAP